MAKEVRIKAKFRERNNMAAKFHDNDDLNADFDNVQIVHTDNYEELYNKPSINEVELKGNKTFEELGDHLLTNIEIKHIFDRVFKGGH